ncbi:MAG: GyrI-like domain-containing protein [Bacteroidetes bacterium MedPE-SWsnd-G1]|nr:MAG: GyrI-like domain-containing protein [Bacteroidetes bacterium MedPE-SWsnd-G1]
MIQPNIIELQPKRMLGKSVRMTLAENKTYELWRSFQMQRSIIENAVGNDLYSLQLYDQLLDPQSFLPTTPFTKWALTEVTNQDNIPKGYKPFVLSGGLYAVFDLIGSIPEFIALNNYIFAEWLPNSNYQLDHRAHFELLGQNYKPNDPASEEQVWIPIKIK